MILVTILIAQLVSLSLTSKTSITLEAKPKIEDNWLYVSNFTSNDGDILVVNKSRLKITKLRCITIRDCMENETLAGCKKIDCNWSCCNPQGGCIMTMVYCMDFDEKEWNYETKQWEKSTVNQT